MARTFELIADEADILLSKDLNPTEIRVAVAIGRGLIGNLEMPNTTLKRALKRLRDTGTITEAKPAKKSKPADPGTAWLSKSQIAPLNADDGTPEFVSYSLTEIGGMGRDGRFQVFCDLMRCDGNDEAIRRAWVQLELDNAKRDGNKISEMVHLYPQIIRSAQHETEWRRQKLRERVNVPQWLLTEQFNNREYGVKPGDPPGLAGDDNALRQRAEKAAQALANLGEVDFVPPGSYEPPLQSARRLEALLSQAKRLRAMQ